MTGIFDSINALIKLADDPNMATAATSVGKAATELPADVRDIRDLMKAMLLELKHMDVLLSRLLPVHPAKWPHVEYQHVSDKTGEGALLNEEELNAATDAL